MLVGMEKWVGWPVLAEGSGSSAMTCKLFESPSLCAL